MGEFADVAGFYGIIFSFAAIILKFFEEEPPDPIWNKLNKIHEALNQIDDNALAIWVTEREENIAFLLSHSAAAMHTAHAFLKSGAQRSDPIWVPRLSDALRDSFVAVNNLTGNLESGVWLRPNSVKAISMYGDPNDWMAVMPDRAELFSFNRVWDYRWALPAALYTITARIIVLRVAGENSELISQEINGYIDFTGKVLKKMQSGIRSLGKLTEPPWSLSHFLNGNFRVVVADIYGGYYLGSISDPISLVSLEGKARKVPLPPFLKIPPFTFDDFVDAQIKIQAHWKNIIMQRIGWGELLRFIGGLENAVKMLTEQSTKLSTLRDKGIDFSVPEADLQEWLNNPDFTPYPAISQATLNLLGTKRLRKPVHLDVIVFKYEETPDVKSPRKLEEVDLAVLRKAVLAAYNERHGEDVTDFQSLLV